MIASILIFRDVVLQNERSTYMKLVIMTKMASMLTNGNQSYKVIVVSVHPYYNTCMKAFGTSAQHSLFNHEDQFYLQGQILQNELF